MRNKSIFLLVTLLLILGLLTSSSKAYAAVTVPLYGAMQAGDQNISAIVNTFNNYGFSGYTVANSMKINNILQTNSSTYSWTDADAQVNYAYTHGKPVHGHVLIWGSDLNATSWVGTLPTGAPMLAFMNNYIGTVVTHFKNNYPNTVKSWDVVNEINNPALTSNPYYTKIDQAGITVTDPSNCAALDEYPVGSGIHYRYKFVDEAFITAHASDSAALLYYNDTGIETNSVAADKIRAMIAGMLCRGVPIDGIGFESHVILNTFNDNLDSFQSNLSKFASLKRLDGSNFKIRISEADVIVGTSTPGTTLLNTQAAKFAQMARACKRIPNCVVFSTWGIDDNFPPNTDAPTLFDRSSPPAPKPAYSAVKSILDTDLTAKLGIYRSSNVSWQLNGLGTYYFGVGGEIPVYADYDGDGVKDLALFMPNAYAGNSRWYINNVYPYPNGITWGVDGDIPVPGDYDGDGKAAIAVYRPSTGVWYTSENSNDSYNFSAVIGITGLIPVAGDYDGDGKTDMGVFQPSSGLWYVRSSSTGHGLIIWSDGAGGCTGSSSTPAAPPYTGCVGAGMIPVPADYDGDGTTDLAAFDQNTGYWYVRASSNKALIHWATTLTGSIYGYGAGMIPVPADYDSDGKADMAVFDKTNDYWYVNGTSAGQLYWGSYNNSGVWPTSWAYNDIPMNKRPTYPGYPF